MGRTPLSGHELDDLKNWALGAHEDDPSDEFPPLLIRLLEENAELRELLYRADKAGELKVVGDLNVEIDRLKALLDRSAQSEKELHENNKGYLKEIRELKEQVAASAAIMHRVGKLMEMAHEKLTGGDGTTLDTVERLAEDTQRKVAPSPKPEPLGLVMRQVIANAKRGA
jgi:hypothetical protein